MRFRSCAKSVYRAERFNWRNGRITVLSVLAFAILAVLLILPTGFEDVFTTLPLIWFLGFAGWLYLAIFAVLFLAAAVFFASKRIRRIRGCR